MPIPAFLSPLLLVATAALLVQVAWTDLRRYRIPNLPVIVLAGLFFAHVALSGRWADALWNVIFAVLMSAPMLVLYARRMMGAGDVKLLTVAFLWVGLDCALPFAILMLIFAALHAGAVKLGWAQTCAGEEDDRLRIAFAPAIAGAVIGVLVLGCLAPPT